MRRIARVSLLWLLAACSVDLAPDPRGGEGSSIGSGSSAVTSVTIPCNGDVSDDIQEALGTANMPDEMIDVKLTAGTCVVSSTLRARYDYTTIRGAGPNVTIVDFCPTSQAVLFKFENTNTPSEGEFSPVLSNTLKNLGIRTDPACDQAKTAVYVHDARNFVMENVTIGPWAANSNRTVGIELRGRDMGLFRKLRIEADVPIRIAENVNEAYDPEVTGSPRYRDITKDLDHHHFEDLTLKSNAAPDPVVEIKSAVVLRNVTFDGHQSWINGGLDWVDSPPPAVQARRHSNHLRLANVRMACSGSCAGQYAIRILKNTTPWMQGDPNGDSGAPPRLEELLVESSVLGDASATWNGILTGKSSGAGTPSAGVQRLILRQVVHQGPNPVTTDALLFNDP